MHRTCPSTSTSTAPAPSRRDFLRHAGAGFGQLALTALLASRAGAAAHRPAVAIDPASPLAPRPPQFPARARNVIFLFMYGGPSSMDLFDYKPRLQELHGKPVPASFKQRDKVGGVFGACKDELMGGPWQWRRHGEGGLWVSDLLPHTARHADDLCLIRSMVSDSSNHAPATFQMNTGVVLSGKPSMGSWVTYGLGSANQNLPGFVVLYKVAGLGGSANWGNGFLPAAFQGTPFRHEGAPVLDLQPPAELAGVQRSTLDAIQALNRKHLRSHPGLLDLEGRIASYELAYRMQSQALDVGDLSTESPETLRLYGVDHGNKDTALFGRMCLLSRRLVEKGVRFVQLYSAVDKFGWDAHDHSDNYLRRNAAQTDQPVAGLLTDLKRRGLLDETLVVWAAEFGRTPMMQGDHGRNHNPYGFTVWLAGGGVRGGQAIGATDDIGLRAAVDSHPVKDLHATLLHALGLNHEELFFEHNGRPERLTGVAGSARIIREVFGA
jgi:hypothetical protein